MPLDDGYADFVCFECSDCAGEYTLRQLRKRNGSCAKCQSQSWRLITEYNERKHAHGVFPLLLHVVFGIETHFRDANTVRIVTPQVPADEALAIAKVGVFKYQRVAFHYMELRRELDGEHERQALRAKGGGNCRICGAFFMPSSEKSWTHSGHCSPSCFAKSGEARFEQQPQPADPNESDAAARPTLSVVCRCGNTFQAAALYHGTRRACPKCGEGVVVGGG